MVLLSKFARRRQNDDMISDIMQNLQHVLNVRKGYGSVIKNMGIGDYNQYHNQKDVVNTIIEEIKENVVLYEPRVQLIDIKEVKSEHAFRIRFELKCRIIEDSRPIYIVFNSIHSNISVEDK